MQMFLHWRIPLWFLYGFPPFLPNYIEFFLVIEFSGNEIVDRQSRFESRIWMRIDLMLNTLALLPTNFLKIQFPVAKLYWIFPRLVFRHMKSIRSYFQLRINFNSLSNYIDNLPHEFQLAKCWLPKSIELIWSGCQSLLN